MSDPRREVVAQAMRDVWFPYFASEPARGKWLLAADAVLAALDATEPAETPRTIPDDLIGGWLDDAMDALGQGDPHAARAFVASALTALDPFVRRPVPSATPAAEPTACPTCGSDDPDRCTFDGFDHEHGHVAGCCPDPWHGGGTADKEHNDAGV